MNLEITKTNLCANIGLDAGHANLSVSYDVIIIGKGVAGLSASIGAVEKGARVLVISDSQVSSTVLAEKGVFRLFQDPLSMYQRIIEYGEGLSKRDLLHTFAGLVKDAGTKLHEVFRMEMAGFIGEKVVGGGPHIVEELERVAAKQGVTFLNGKVIKVLTSEHRVTAVQILWYPDLLTIRAKAVVIACGGIGPVYFKSDNSRSVTIPGCSLALDAGARLRDIEFILFHPFVSRNYFTIYHTKPIFTFFDLTGLPLYNKDGLRLNELEEMINSGMAHQLINELAREVSRINSVYFNNGYENIFLEPAQHSLIGGIDNDSECKTCVQGLYAAGESMGGLNGANRMAGMSLLEGFLLGRKAGENAAQYSNINSYHYIDEETALPDNLMYGYLSPHRINKIQSLADRALFIERDENTLLNCNDELEKIIRNIDTNTLTGYLELGVARMALAITKASLLRKESRGAFFRKDYPRCDAKLGHSIIISNRNGEILPYHELPAISDKN